MISPFCVDLFGVSGYCGPLEVDMRQRIETAYELSNGGEPVMPWLWDRYRAGVSVTMIAGRLSVICGFHVSEDVVLQMLRDG